VSRPRGFADLAGLVVGVWGVGVEGSATARRLAGLAGAVRLVDDRADAAPGVTATGAGGVELLAGCDVVLKSPGISRHRPELAVLVDAGVLVTSALNCWMGETDRSHVIGVTGTKGKSTTTELATFALRALGEDASAAGNIGLAPYDPDRPATAWTVLEISSFQAVDLEVAPAVIAITSLGVDHLDWHGTPAQYWADKLSLTRAPGDHVTLLAPDNSLLSQRDQIGGDVVVAEPVSDDVVSELGLLGRHNARNVGLALAAVAHATRRTLDDVLTTVRTHANQFTPLPGRLSLVRRIDNVTFVDDGLATSVLPTVAALEVFADAPVALIVGGSDRGVDYTALVDSLRTRHAPTCLVVMDDAGHRIGALADGVVVVHTATSMADAVERAHAGVRSGGVVLLSPAAPSFSRYRNWKERSDDFRRVVGELTH
jgi:UDP-N-acetylmuramoyl-L-alanine---L-glutamate ligase